jgi:hypothetical protein
MKCWNEDEVQIASGFSIPLRVFLLAVIRLTSVYASVV